MDRRVQKNGDTHSPTACPDSPNGNHLMESAQFEWANAHYDVWAECCYCGTTVQLGCLSLPQDWESNHSRSLTGG
jgi:hypothetical protein